MSQPGIDELFDVKNAYYIGNYQKCINESEKLKVNAELTVEKTVFEYRAYIAQRKYRVVLGEIKDNAPKKLIYIRTLAAFFAYPDQRSELLNAIDHETVSSEDESEMDLYRLVCATMYYNSSNCDKALEYCFHANSLECKALAIQIYIELNRLDLAKNEMKKMIEKDEDSTITQISQAWLNIYLGGDKLQDAYYIYQELIDKYGETNTLRNGQAVALLMQGKREDAQSALQEALTKNPNSPDTLINMIVLSHHMGKPEAAQRFLAQLRESNPEHKYLQQFDERKKQFRSLCKSYAASIST